MSKEKGSFLNRFTGTRSGESDKENQNTSQKVSLSSSDNQEQTNMHINNHTPYSQPLSPQEPSWNPNPEPAEQQPAEDVEGQLTIDVYQTENDIIIKSTIAGVKPENLDVSISNDMITIRGDRILEEEVADENYYYQECYWGSFSRSVVLPTDVLTDKIDASLKNGILTIKLPKADITKTKKIQVRGF